MHAAFLCKGHSIRSLTSPPPSRLAPYCRNDVPDSVGGQCRGSAAKVQTGHGLLARTLAADHVDLANERIDISTALFLFVSHLAVRTEAAYPSAEGNVHVQSQAFAFRKGQRFIVLIFEDKRFDGSGEQRSRQVCDIVLDMDNNNNYPLAIHGEGVPA